MAGVHLDTQNKRYLPEKANTGETALQQLDPLQKRLVVWMAKGKTTSTFAKKYAMAIVPKHEGSEAKRMKKARARCRAWAHSETFRQALWDWSVNEMDLATPSILQGITAKAAAGRVDAARLALEITGRHAPNVDVQPASIQIVMGGVPRPATPMPDDAIEGEAEEIVDVDAEEAL